MREGENLHKIVIKKIQKKKKEGSAEEVEKDIKGNKGAKKEILHGKSVKMQQKSKEEAKEFLKPSTDLDEKRWEKNSVEIYRALKEFIAKDDHRTALWEMDLTKDEQKIMKDLERNLRIGDVYAGNKKAIKSPEEYVERIKSFIEEMKTHEDDPGAQKMKKSAEVMLIGIGKESMKSNDPKIAKQVFDYTDALEDFPTLGKVVGALAKQKGRSEQKKLEQEKENQSQVSRDKGYAAYMALTQEKPQEGDPLLWEINNFSRSLKEGWLSAGFNGQIRIKGVVRKPEDYIREVERELNQRQATVGLKNMPYMKEAIKWFKCLLEGFGKAAKEKGDKDIKKRVDEILGNIE